MKQNFQKLLIINGHNYAMQAHTVIPVRPLPTSKSASNN